MREVVKREKKIYEKHLGIYMYLDTITTKLNHLDCSRYRFPMNSIALRFSQLSRDIS